ncbi:MAG: hypothetical protein JRG73_11125 [Deltaproteobacteria bacterium]|nr:hypothetical protein [Deltaproteobacteria bacterium]MBW2307475.1 hypothetical protein [Deltaproteobacteria bacterium]
MVKTLQIIFFVALGISIAADFLTTTRDHPVFWWHYVPGFDAVFGVVACLLLIKGSKALAKHWLQRREDYYD